MTDDSWEAQLQALEAGLSGSASGTAEFAQELARMQAGLSSAGREVSALSTGIGRGLRQAFDGLVFDGASLSGVLKDLARSMSDTAYSAAMRPVQTALGGAVSEGLQALVGAALPFAKGGVFSQGRVRAFATGGVVTGPTQFPMRGGTGLMGEAGPEAILPLARGADGRLGVRAQAGSAGAVSVVMNISTPDPAGFRRSQSQIAAEMGRLLARGQRNR